MKKVFINKQYNLISTIIAFVSLFALTMIMIIPTFDNDSLNRVRAYTPSQYTQVSLSKPFEEMPLTFCAWIHTPKNTQPKGSLFGNLNRKNISINYTINKNSNPEVVFIDPKLKKHTITFNNIFFQKDKKLHIAFVTDVANKKLKCYINGKLKQSKAIDITKYIPTTPFIIGGDDFYANANTYNGKIYTISAYSTVCSNKQLQADMNRNINTNNKKLLVHYNFETKSKLYSDSSIYKNNLIVDNIWAKNVPEIGDFDYSMAVIGDTQILSAFYPEKLSNLYDWLVDNQEEHKIELVMGLGDITEYSKQYEWIYAKEQIYKLNDKIPYTLVPGNHDHYTNYMKEAFTDTFNDGIYNAQITGQMSSDNLNNTYKAITIGSQKYLIMCLDFYITDEVIDWASSVISNYADHKVIFTSHSYMFNDGTTVDAGDLYPPTSYNKNVYNGDMLWEALVSKHENIMMYLSGHDPCDTIVYRQDLGDNGNVVTQMLIDPQRLDEHLDGYGMVAMLYFSNNGKTMTVRYYSTVHNTYISDLAQFTIDLYA